MSTKTRRQLSALLFALIIVLGISLIKFHVLSWMPHTIFPVFSTIHKSDIISLSIIGEKDVNTLYKKNGEWVVKKNQVDYKADTERIEAVIDSLLSIKKSDLISTNRNQQKDFGIGKQKVTFKTNTETQSVYIGNVTTLSSNFVRLNNENFIYTADGFSSLYYPEDYRDFSLHLISNEEFITSLHEFSADTSLFLTKNSEDWSIGQQEAIKEKVNFFLNDIKTLKAAAIEPSTTVDLTVLEKVLSLQLREGVSSKTADVYKIDDESYYVKVSDNEYLYKIKPTDLTSLTKSEADFLN